MPLVTLTLRRDPAPTVKRAMLDAIHHALVASGVPPADRFQRVIVPAAGDLVVDPRYPDLARDRGEGSVIVEVLWSVGRSVKVKRKLLADLTAILRESPGLDPEDVMLVFKETQWENWAFAGGRQIHV